MPELIVILIVALVIIGPKKLPDLARSLGKGLAEFRRATDDVKESLNVDGIRDEVHDLKDSIIYGKEEKKAKADSKEDTGAEGQDGD